MSDFNWIDVIIILVLLNAIYNGIRAGFLTLALVFGGIFAAIFLGGWLFPHLLPIADQTTKAAFNLGLILSFAAFVGTRAFDLGRHIHLSLGEGKFHLVESAAGVVLSVVSALIIVWLLAAGIGSLPFAGLSNSANDSMIVQALDRRLPSVPAVFERFSTVVNPNSQPKVFVKSLPNSSMGSSPLPQASQAVFDAGASTVRITSFGCGGIVNGSGFVVAPDLVITNAHVIAGVDRPVVKYRLQSLEAKPVFFDPGLDFAALRVNGLKAKPLRLEKTNLSKGTTVYAIGYPKSIFTISPGMIHRNQHVLSSNIYGLGTFDKDVYEVESKIDQGSSGGPIVTADGLAAGILFAKTNSGNYGYALTTSGLLDEIDQAENSSSRVGTGACLAN